MFKIFLILVGSIFVVAILISYLTFFFYIKKIFVENVISSGETKREAIKVWKQCRSFLLKKSYRIVFRGGR